MISVLKMSNRKYIFTWPNYNDHLKQMLQTMKDDESSQDVTLVCDDKTKIKAHQIVLKTCSSLFESMFEGLSQPNPIVFLRGIQHQELESVLKFMYLGETTYYQDRMSDLLNVAKILEVKELINVVEVSEDILSPSENSTSESLLHKKSKKSVGSLFVEPSVTTTTVNDLGLQSSQKSKHEVVIYSCDMCDYEATNQRNLTVHVKIKHKGIKYPCKKCDYISVTPRRLKLHVKVKHEGVCYPCGQCDYKAPENANLKIHIQSKHEGIKYPCNQCDYEATQQGNLKAHIKSKHEGFRYPCDWCAYEACDQSNLKRHLKFKHK